jgi:hypothetical protein
VDWAWPARQSNPEQFLKHTLATHLLTLWGEGRCEAEMEAGSAGEVTETQHVQMLGLIVGISGTCVAIIAATKEADAVKYRVTQHEVSNSQSSRSW